MRFKFLRQLPLFFLLPVLAHALPGYYEPWGKDADLKYSPVQLTQEARPTRSIAVRVAEQVILFHQNVLSPVDGPRSHFRPSSSSYMMQAMQKHGFVEGFLMGCDRLMRENSDDWVYRKIEENGKLFKHDPVR
jgi:uncharacterized protein